ncbi:MAG: GNAT family N-acetyltransferase [Candidatus Methylopumilus sp.]|nr:GNAT family N-acetyltransferase [Candidatus Methylopumilus sp.]
MKSNLQIDIANWIDAYDALKMIRQKVFIEEQKVPIDLEWDGIDERAIHFLAYQDGKVIGCARGMVSNDSLQLGRMAVLKEMRHQGVGRALIEKVMLTAKVNHLKSIAISAQCHAINFYMKFGFKIMSEIYLDVNIPHRDMLFEF